MRKGRVVALAAPATELSALVLYSMHCAVYQLDKATTLVLLKLLTTMIWDLIWEQIWSVWPMAWALRRRPWCAVCMAVSAGDRPFRSVYLNRLGANAADELWRETQPHWQAENVRKCL